jgi:hypothetical protein
MNDIFVSMGRHLGKQACFACPAVRAPTLDRPLDAESDPAGRRPADPEREGGP